MQTLLKPVPRERAAPEDHVELSLAFRVGKSAELGPYQNIDGNTLISLNRVFWDVNVKGASSVNLRA